MIFHALRARKAITPASRQHTKPMAFGKEGKREERGCRMNGRIGYIEQRSLTEATPSFPLPKHAA